LFRETGIKLSSVAADITGVSGRAMLEALASGQHDPLALAELARRRMRSKIPELREALTGRFTQHHAFLTRVHLDLIDHHTRAIDDVTARIEVVIEPFQGIRDMIITIPGISTGVADVIIAETGADMTRFPTAGHLASWAGTCPGSNESAGRVKSTSTRPGNPYLKGALGIAAMSAARSKGTYLSAKYRRIASRRGPVKAIVLEQDHQRCALRRPRRRLLHPPQPRQDQAARHRPAAPDRIRRHPPTAKDSRSRVNLRVRDSAHARPRRGRLTAAGRAEPQS
jgi:transposase